ncbi:MAG: hypothetical protein M3Y64_03815 [Gemmatimonadota bacterium]|nr:hypothetical protein [Gemmatimonadota bacterium]
MPTRPPRRDFLSWLGLSSAAAASATLFGPAVLQGEGSKPRDGSKWDMSWTKKLKHKVRAVFDATTIADGASIYRASIWRDQYAEVYGTKREDVNAVLVIRHQAIDLIMNDEYWSRFKIAEGEAKKVDGDAARYFKDADGAFITKNPIREADPKATAATKDYNLTDFMAQGGIVLGCGLAFKRPVARFQKGDSLSAADADKAAREHIIPGIILQPSGIFAVLRAQEAGCDYVLAS